MTKFTPTIGGGVPALRLTTDPHRAAEESWQRKAERWAHVKREVEFAMRLALGTADVDDDAVSLVCHCFTLCADEPERHATIRELAGDRPVLYRPSIPSGPPRHWIVERRDLALAQAVVAREGFAFVALAIGRERLTLGLLECEGGEALAAAFARSGVRPFIASARDAGHEEQPGDPWAAFQRHWKAVGQAPRAAMRALAVSATRLAGVDIDDDADLPGIWLAWQALDEDQQNAIAGAAQLLDDLTPRRDDEARGWGPA